VAPVWWRRSGGAGLVGAGLVGAGLVGAGLADAAIQAQRGLAGQ